MANVSGSADQRGGLFSRIAADFTTRAWVLIPIGVGINAVIGTLVNALQLPIFLDVIGTILVAILAGPWVAALTGLVTNLVLGITAPTVIAFTPVNVAIGLAAGYLALHGYFKTPLRIFLSGLVITAIGVLMSSPILVLVFGGVSSGSRGALIGFFLATGSNIWQSVVTTSAIVEIVDKLISVFVAVGIARAIPERYRPQKARQTL